MLISDQQMASQFGYQFYIPQAGLMPAQAQPWGLPPVAKDDHLPVGIFYPAETTEASD